MDLDEHIRTKPAVRPRWALWRSPVDQPAWARPVLLCLAAVAAVTYTLGIEHDLLEPYYAAGVRSMAASWHGFLFAAFDPQGTITMDKLPGAFWLQALSVRVFGVHVWAFVLPQVVAGVLTVLALYRAVRTLAGPPAGIAAAAILVASPAAVALNRGNVSDSLLVLFLVLAAGSCARAIVTGGARPLLVSAIWVGLAFHTKMAQAWLIVPALAVAYVLAGPRSRRRLGLLAGAGALAGAVSLAWMTFVALVPASDRPYVDGSVHNSAFEQAFVYNGTGRLAGQGPLAELGALSPLEHAAMPGPGWDRFLSGAGALSVGWLLPAALVIAVAGLARSGGLLRPAYALWGTWLVVHLVVLSAAPTVLPYYAAVMAPAIAALCGMATAALRRPSPTTQPLAGSRLSSSSLYALAGAATAGYAAWLLRAAPGVAVVIVAAGVLTAAAVAARRSRAALVLGAAGSLLAPLLATASVVAAGRGPFDVPLEPPRTAAAIRALVGGWVRPALTTVPALERARLGSPVLVTTYTSVLASAYVLGTGEEALPIGGFTGTAPSPTLDEIKQGVASGRIHVVLTSETADRRIAWIRARCRALPPASSRPGLPPISAYLCMPGDAAP
jgi:4-amino-4-deoxy-L-arabinose transferase-like glycosyltransferase